MRAFFNLLFFLYLLCFFWFEGEPSPFDFTLPVREKNQNFLIYVLHVIIFFLFAIVGSACIVGQSPFRTLSLLFAAFFGVVCGDNAWNAFNDVMWVALTPVSHALDRNNLFALVFDASQSIFYFSSDNPDNRLPELSKWA